MPIFTTLFFIFTIFNTAVPLSLNWIGEFLALSGTFENSPLISGFGALGIILSACYSIWMYNRVSYGSFSPYLKPMLDINRREFHLLLPLLLLTLLLGIFPNIIFEILHLSVSNILYVLKI
jgi:NADH-ubiquinone oxidoreductase chain 4